MSAPKKGPTKITPVSLRPSSDVNKLLKTVQELYPNRSNRDIIEEALRFFYQSGPGAQQLASRQAELIGDLSARVEMLEQKTEALD